MGLDSAAGTPFPACLTGRGDAPVEDRIGSPYSVPFDLDAVDRRLARHGNEP